MADPLSRRNFVALGSLALLAAGRPARAQGRPGANPGDLRIDPDWLASLADRGQPEIFSGRQLRYIGQPCGGIGCGQLYLGGDGRLWHWDIFNLTEPTGDAHYAEPLEPTSPLDCGFAVSLTSRSQRQTRELSSSGWSVVRFRGAWPQTTIDYEDAQCPVRVRLTASSPTIPGRLDDSSWPAVLLDYTVTNDSQSSVDLQLAGWLQNAASLRSGADWGLTRVNRLERLAGLLWLDCSARRPAVDSAARPPIVLADFEGDDWAGWEVSGEAFGPAPSRRAGRDQRLSGFVGRGLANSYPDSDGPTGRLRSPEFTIERRWLCFRLGGGNHPGETCLNLLLDGQIVRSATGANTDAMRPESWDLADLVGQRAVLEVVDTHSGGWGHIDIDQIELRDEPLHGFEAAEDEPDWGTLGLALFEARPDDLGWAALPGGQVPAGLFGGVEPVEQSEAPADQPGPRGALARTLALAPGASATVSFALCWHFANLYLDGQRRGREYGRRFANAKAVVSALAPQRPSLQAATKLWHDTWYDSTLPYWLLDRALVGANCLATSTTQRWADGRVWGWEGVGCCAGTCTHVWHYGQAAARLWPELERIVRERQDFGPGLAADGQIGMRGEWNGRAAVDGHAGTILRVLREHQMSADDGFGRRLWPRVKRALEWLIGQDGNGDGYLENGQHNTLDTDWYGPHAWFNSLYVAALEAGAALAGEFGEAELAQRYRALAASGAKLLSERLFNGEYFIQLKDPAHPEALGSGLGCEVDQIFGAHWARMVGLPAFVPADQERSALASLWRYNFTPDVGPYRTSHPSGRWYAMPGEPGLLMCTFPRGGQAEALGEPPVWASMYFNECMNGFEYQVAGHLLWAGLVTEGLAVARAVHDRYDPAKRNPYNEVECGDHYARSMSSYGVFLAACGYEYHGPAGHLGFAPRLSPERFRCAFTAAEGWGTYQQRRDGPALAASVALRFGRLRLRSLSFEVAQAPATANVKLGPRELPATLSVDGTRAVLRLAAEVTLQAGQTLTAELG